MTSFSPLEHYQTDNVNACLKKRKIVKIKSEYKAHFGVPVNFVKLCQPKEMPLLL